MIKSIQQILNQETNKKIIERLNDLEKKAKRKQRWYFRYPAHL